MLTLIMSYIFQLRASTEKLANGIQMGINYRLYAIERVSEHVKRTVCITSSDIILYFLSRVPYDCKIFEISKKHVSQHVGRDI